MGHRGPTPAPGAPYPLAAPGGVWPPWPTPEATLRRTSSPRWKNPKYREPEEFRRRCGAENTREKRALRQAGICR